MARSVPIACTLGATGLAAQRRRWERLMTEALTGREETPDGLRLSFRPGAEDELRALVAIERECCPWASWTVMAGPGEVTLGIRAPAEGAAVLYEMFRAAPGGPSGARASASSPGQARTGTRR